MGAAGSKDAEDVFLDAVDDGAAPVASEASATPDKAKRASVTKLYKHDCVGSSAKWNLVVENPRWKFVQGDENEDGDSEDDKESEDEAHDWYLQIPGWARVRVSDQVTFKFNDDSKRVDFHSGPKGPLAVKFGTAAEYRDFVEQYQRCMFENVHKMEYSEANVASALGKEFVKGWMHGQDGDEIMWDAEDDLDPKEAGAAKETVTPSKERAENLAAKRSPLGLAMGALDNSFLLHSEGIDVYQNEREGLQGRGVTINLQKTGTPTPRKGMLIRGETGMMLMSPSAGAGTPHADGLRQLDLEREKVVAEWKFEKDGVPIQMRDITGDTKGAQLESDQATFLGLDDNRLCRWDMRDKHGIVQQLASPALAWAEGHQFSRGTNFQCFASTGDGSVAVGSRDGKIRLYSTTTMRQAKTAFPGLGSPITHIDVTYDGHWVLGTTDKFLVLINTMFRDAKGNDKCAFTSRVGGNLAAPRLLRLLPKHVELAGADFKFQKAGFSWVTESGKSERYIVAAVGKYSVVWNFRTVRQPNHSCYSSQSVGLKTCTCYNVVRRGDESVVDSKFMHDRFDSPSKPEGHLVIATPHKLASLQLD